jgi:small multidrug resistance pump
MGWYFLIAGALLEAAGTVCLRLSQGFVKTHLVVVGIACFIVSVVPLTLALRRTEMSAAYALWSALDIAIVTVIGMLWLQEAANFSKLLALGLILAGVVLLNLQPHAA